MRQGACIADIRLRVYGDFSHLAVVVPSWRVGNFRSASWPHGVAERECADKHSNDARTRPPANAYLGVASQSCG